MASRRNAIKKIRADERKRVINRATASEIRTLTRKLIQLCHSKQNDSARAAGQTLFSKLDKAVKKGVLKENTVNRRKSLISTKINRLSTPH